MPDAPSAALKRLAATLAEWSAGTNFTIYLFGSRVRGDHRLDSDVDVVIPLPTAPADVDVLWWSAINNDLFASIDAKLPGKLHILENTDPLACRVVDTGKQSVFMRDRNVICVWLPPRFQ